MLSGALGSNAVLILIKKKYSKEKKQCDNASYFSSILVKPCIWQGAEHL